MSFLQFGGLAVGLALLVLLGPLWSAKGAAAASSISYVLLLVGQLVALRIKPRDAMPTFRAFRSGVRSILPG